MKRFFILYLPLILTVMSATAQSSVEQYRVDITYNKTSSLIFSAGIQSVDKGSRDILAQKAKGVNNVLQLKAARDNFPQTNLTVITADGNLHQFTVNYAKEPENLSMDLRQNDKRISVPLLLQSEIAGPELEKYSARIAALKPAIMFKQKKSGKVSLALRAIYIHENVIFYHFQIENKSNINYDIEFLRFFIQDRTRVKRTAFQQLDIVPVCVFGNAEHIKGRSAVDVVYALEKFTIPDAKNLVVEMFEKNGGRNLNLFIKNKTIVNARTIP